MANVIVKETLHPDNDNNIDIYPKTSYDQVEGAPDAVTANPTEEGTTDLTKLKVGNIVYNIPSGGSVSEKLYKHKIELEASSILSLLIFYVYNRSNTTLTLNDIAGEYFLASVLGGMRSGVVSCIIEASTLKLKTEGVVINSTNEVFVLNSETDRSEILVHDTVTEV